MSSVSQIEPSVSTTTSARRGLLLGVAPRGQPSLNGGGALPAAASGQQARDTNMLVEIRPFDGVPVAQQVPIATFLLVCLR